LEVRESTVFIIADARWWSLRLFVIYKKRQGKNHDAIYLIRNKNDKVRNQCLDARIIRKGLKSDPLDGRLLRLDRFSDLVKVRLELHSEDLFDEGRICPRD